MRHNIGSGKKLVLHSLRNLEFFLEKRCPYIHQMLELLDDLGCAFRPNSELLTYFDWNEELLAVEKHCFAVFVNELRDNLRANRYFAIENILEHEYLHAPSYKQIEQSFERDPQHAKGGLTQNCPSSRKPSRPSRPRPRRAPGFGTTRFGGRKLFWSTQRSFRTTTTTTRSFWKRSRASTC